MLVMTALHFETGQCDTSRFGLFAQDFFGTVVSGSIQRWNRLLLLSEEQQQVLPYINRSLWVVWHPTQFRCMSFHLFVTCLKSFINVLFSL